MPTLIRSVLLIFCKKCLILQLDLACPVAHCGEKGSCVFLVMLIEPRIRAGCLRPRLCDSDDGVDLHSCSARPVRVCLSACNSLSSLCLPPTVPPLSPWLYVSLRARQPTRGRGAPTRAGSWFNASRARPRHRRAPRPGGLGRALHRRGPPPVQPLVHLLHLILLASPPRSPRRTHRRRRRRRRFWRRARGRSAWWKGCA